MMTGTPRSQGSSTPSFESLVLTSVARRRAEAVIKNWKGSGDVQEQLHALEFGEVGWAKQKWKWLLRRTTAQIQVEKVKEKLRTMSDTEPWMLDTHEKKEKESKEARVGNLAEAVLRIWQSKADSSNNQSIPGESQGKQKWRWLLKRTRARIDVENMKKKLRSMPGYEGDVSEDEEGERSRFDSCPEDHLPAAGDQEELSEEALSYEELVETVADLREKLIHAAELGQHLLETKEELEQDLEDAVQDSWHYKTENKDLWDKIAEQTNELTTLRTVNIKLEVKTRELMGDNMGPKDLSEISVPHSPVRPTTPHHERYKRKFEEAEAELKSTELEMAGLRRHISNLEGKLDEAELEKIALSRRLDEERAHAQSIKSRTPRGDHWHHQQQPFMGSYRSFREKSSNDLKGSGKPSSSLKPMDNSHTSWESLEFTEVSSPHATAPITSPTAVSSSPGDAGHRRGGGLGKKKSNAEMHRSVGPSLSHDEFNIIMEQARKFELKRESQLHNSDDDLKEQVIEEDEQSFEEEFYPTAYVEEMRTRITTLESEMEQMQTLIGAQRSQIRQYRENEKSHYVFTSMTSGDYSNLASELALLEKKGVGEGVDTLSVIDEEQSRASSNGSGSRGGCSHCQSSSRGHRRSSTSTSRRTASPLESPNCISITEITERGPQQRDVNQGKLKSRPGETPLEAPLATQARSLAKITSPDSGNLLAEVSVDCAQSPESVKEAKNLKMESKLPSTESQMKVPLPPPILVVKGASSHEVVREAIAKKEIKAGGSEQKLCLKSASSMKQVPVTRSSKLDLEQKEDMLLYGDVKLAEELQKERKINLGLQKELKKAQLQSSRRRVGAWTFIGISCAIFVPSIISSIVPDQPHFPQFPSYSTYPVQLFTNMVQKNTALNVIWQNDVFENSHTTQSVQHHASKCCCPQKKELDDRNSKAHQSCSPQYIPTYCKVTNRVLEAINIPYHVCAMVDKFSSLLHGYFA